jgi:hypothetical protein
VKQRKTSHFYGYETQLFKIEKILHGFLQGRENTRRGKQGRKLTCKQGLEGLECTYHLEIDLAFNRTAWKSAIHMLEP